MNRQHRILVADDEPALRSLMGSALRKAGFEVTLAVDGEDALHQFQSTPCDLIMLDVSMPNLDGYEACVALRAQAGNELPIIMVTGMDDLDSIKRAFESGATDFMAKPINLVLLGHRITYLLRAHQVVRDLHRANARNAAILNALPDELFRLDVEGRIMSAYPPLQAAPVIDPKSDPLLGERYPAYVAEQLYNGTMRALQSGSVQSVGFRLSDENSREQHFEARIAAIDDQESLCLVRDITDFKNAENALSEIATLMQEAQAVARLGSWFLDIKLEKMVWTPEIYRIYHIPDTEPPSYEAIVSRTHPEDLALLQQAWENSLAGKPYEYEKRIIVDDQIRWIFVHAKFESDADNVAIRCIGTAQDVTERKVQQLQTLSAQSRLQATLDALPDLMFVMDSEGRYLDYHCPAHKTHLMIPGKIIGNTVTNRLPANAAATYISALREAAVNGFSNGKQFMIEASDGVRWYELSVARKTTTHIDGQRFVVLARDITERKDAEVRIHNLAYFDSLTRLPSRLSFIERLEREVQRAKVMDAKLGVLFLDLDGFKTINDTLGHMIGDQALQEVAERLQSGLRPSDLLARGNPIDSQISLARLGGDEFTVLLLDLKNAEDAMVVAQRINELLRHPFHIEDNELVLTASIGIAIFPNDGNNSAALLKHADSAMYSAKDGGRDSYQFYRPSMTRSAVERMQMDHHLRQALEREEFFLAYQPQYDLVRGGIHSVEALIRWNHPQRGLVSPMEFIPRIEANGLIVPIGEWVLRTACRDLMSWQPYSSELRMAVNISPLQFRDPSLLNTIQMILNATGVLPAKLELEVTEGGLMNCNEANLQTLHALRETGITIALDDFGTGYSSMSYLKRLPLDHIKVDQSFIRGLPDSKDSLAIVKAIISLAKNLDFTVTAEGVETIEQVLLLKNLYCDQLQGFFFSKAVPAHEIPKLLSRRWSTDIRQPLPRQTRG